MIDRESEAELRDLYGDVGYTIIDDVLSLPERRAEYLPKVDELKWIILDSRKPSDTVKYWLEELERLGEI